MFSDPVSPTLSLVSSPIFLFLGLGVKEPLADPFQGTHEWLLPEARALARWLFSIQEVLLGPRQLSYVFPKCLEPSPMTRKVALLPVYFSICVSFLSWLMATPTPRPISKGKPPCLSVAPPSPAPAPLLKHFSASLPVSSAYSVILRTVSRAGARSSKFSRLG